jgi:hypothetical protein
LKLLVKISLLSKLFYYILALWCGTAAIVIPIGAIHS